jgi:glycosyltransferase involved in cell wall biosynthesis
MSDLANVDPALEIEIDREEDPGQTIALSVCLLARDEESELARCLAAVEWADEIVVVVDDRSCDGTERVARELASRVERRAYAGDVEQKRYCTSLAKHDWVLILDPDEVVPAELADSIRAALAASGPSAQGETMASGNAAGDPPVAYRLNRITYHLGRWIRHGDFYPDWKLRLFRRSRARFVGFDPHGRVEVEGEVGVLAGDLEHYSYRDLSDQVQRIQFFSDQAADALMVRQRPFRIRDLVLRPPARFLRSYLLKQGFRDGLPGFVIAVASGFYVFLKYAKQWERLHWER